MNGLVMKLHRKPVPQAKCIVIMESGRPMKRYAVRFFSASLKPAAPNVEKYRNNCAASI